MGKKVSENPVDPIAYEALRREKEERVDGLFKPITPSGERPAMEWLIPGFIPKGYLALLAADPKEGKSSLATALALAVATGTPFAGMPTRQAAVLWLSMEEGPDERNFLLDQSPLADPATPLYTCYDHLPIDDEETLEMLEQWIDRAEAGLIVVDPLHGAQSGRSLTDAWAARKTLMKLKELCTRRRVTALVLHHAALSLSRRTRKKVAENAQLAATASMEMVMGWRKVEIEEAGRGEGRLITLRCKGRGDFSNRVVHFLSKGPLDFSIVETPRETPPAVHDETSSRQQDRVLEALKARAKTSAELIEELQVHAGSLRNLLTNLRRGGLVRVISQKGHVRTYGLTTIGKPP